MFATRALLAVALCLAVCQLSDALMFDCKVAVDKKGESLRRARRTAAKGRLGVGGVGWGGCAATDSGLRTENPSALTPCSLL